MTLDDYWFTSSDVEKFVRVLEKLGYQWDIVDLQERPTLRIWKKRSKDKQSPRIEIVERTGFYW